MRFSKSDAVINCKIHKRHQANLRKMQKSLNDIACESVRQLRLDLKLKGKDVAVLTQGVVSNSTLSRLESGETRWTLDNLEAVAHALGVDPRDLLPGPDEPAAGAARPNPSEPPLSPAERALLDAARAGDGAAAVVALARFFITQPDGKDRT